MSTWQPCILTLGLTDEIRSALQERLSKAAGTPIELQALESLSRVDPDAHIVTVLADLSDSSLKQLEHALASLPHLPYTLTLTGPPDAIQAARDTVPVPVLHAGPTPELDTLADPLHAALNHAQDAWRHTTEAKLSHLLAGTGETLVVVLDEDWRVVYVSPSIEDATGYTLEDLRGEEWFDVVVPREEYPDVWETFKDLGHEPVPEVFENPIRTAEGDERIVRWHNNVWQEDESVLGVVSIGIDVTERREAVRALEASEQRARSLLESAPDAMIVTEPDGTITMANTAAEDLFGYSRAQLAGEPVEKLVPDRFATQHVEDREGYIADPERRPMGAGLDLTALRADGSEVPVEISLSPVRTETGVVVVAAVRDRREREAMQERVRALQRLPIEMTEAAGEREALEVALQGACEAAGWSLGEGWVRRGDALELVAAWHRAEDASKAFLDQREETRLGQGDGVAGSVWASRELTWVHDPSRVHLPASSRELLGSGARVSLVAVPVQVENDVEAVLVFYVADPSEADRRFVDVIASVAAQLGTVLDRIQTNAALRERTREVEATNEELEAFTQAVSHDLREPLRTVEGLTHHVVNRFEDELPDDAAFLLGRVQRASHRMNDLLSALERLTKISRQEIQRRDIEIRTVAEEVLRELPLDGITVNVETDARVYADPSLLGLLIQNLVENAAKFTREEADPTITIGTRQDGGQTVHYVEDNGVGFNPDRADAVFEPLRRLHGDAYEGTGIGLATVRRIVHRHNGDVWAEGERGEGATIFFTLGEDPEPR